MYICVCISLHVRYTWFPVVCDGTSVTIPYIYMCVCMYVCVCVCVSRYLCYVTYDGSFLLSRKLIERSAQNPFLPYDTLRLLSKPCMTVTSPSAGQPLYI